MLDNLNMSLPGLDVGVWLAIAAGAVFVACVLLFTTVQAIVGERRALNRTLRAVRAIELPDSRAIRRRELATPTTERVLGPALRRIAAIARRYTPAGTYERLDQQLKRLGSPAGWDAGRVLAVKCITPLALLPLAFLIAGLYEGSFFTYVVAVIAAVGAGWYLPELLIRSRGSERQKEIQKALPDSLDLLSITVEAGLGFDSALNRVAGEVQGPLGQELHRVVQEVQLGEERVEALRGLADRNDVPELKSFVLAMIQADILGISVAQVLEVQAREMRIKRRQRAEEKAMKLPVKIVFPLILCIFPALFVILLGPAAIRISETLFQML